MHPRPGTTRFIGVELEHVSLELGGRAVLRSVDWRIEPGQRWVLIGPNGSGKTQLLKLIAGDVWPTPGRGARRYLMRGELHEQPYEVKQYIAYLGSERQDRYEHYRWNYRVEEIVATGLKHSDIPLEALAPEERRVVAYMLHRLGLEPLARRRFLTLSYGERRLVLLARALTLRPKLLLLDELFNGLDAINRARATACLAALSRSGLPWVLSCHRESDVPASTTHLCRLERGRLRCYARPRGAAPAAPAAAAVAASGRRRRAAALTRAVPAARRARAEPLILLRQASLWRDGRRILRCVSLAIRRGECWIVHGPNGSGKSSLIQTLYGDLGVATGGSIWRGLGHGMPLETFRRRVGLVAPELQAMHPLYLRVEEVVGSGLYASIGLQAAARAAQRARVRSALGRFGAAGLATRGLRALSYGQLRRVLFARAFIGRPELLLLDEPYAGLDTATRATLKTHVDAAVGRGVTAVLATHHFEDWPAGATHELELSRAGVRYAGALRSRTRDARGRSAPVRS